MASGKLHGVEAQAIVLKGNIDEQMESFACARHVALIVVGTHGRQGMARLFFGSFAQLISKCCCCPVLTVGPHTSGPWLGNPADSERPLLFATAFDKASAKAMPYAISMANDFERQLFVLHVMPPHHSYLLYKDRLTHENIDVAAREHLSALIRPAAALKRTANFLVEFGDPADDLVEAPATPEQKEMLEKLSAQQVKITELAGEKIQTILTHASGNGAPIGGLKVVAESGWFAARPSGTENIYKIYAESFRGEEHVRHILEEAQTIVNNAIAPAAPSKK